ncbi:hypothetical protein Sm713_10790 [Streptomyces sp. TS71-3]|nr:hypothetical protein Sm713_10790 [Streptomyces sp. TS71-3]
MPSPLSVWNTAPTSAPAQRKGRYVPGSAAHPAKMLPAIAAHAITTYTRPGDLVLDPMCGIGTTLVEALRLGRHAVGTEYEPRWAHLASANVAYTMQSTTGGSGHVACGDARRLTDLLDERHRGNVDLVITSPPYGNSVHGQVRSTRETGERGVLKKDYRYSQDLSNLAHISTDRLLKAFTEILDQCRRLLRPGGVVVVTTPPLARTRRTRRLAVRRPRGWAGRRPHAFRTLRRPPRRHSRQPPDQPPVLLPDEERSRRSPSGHSAHRYSARGCPGLHKARPCPARLRLWHAVFREVAKVRETDLPCNASVALRFQHATGRAWRALKRPPTVNARNTPGLTRAPAT